MKIRLFSVISSVLVCASLSAQTKDFDYVLDINPYLTSGNAAHFAQFKGEKLAVAGTEFVKENGGNVDLTGSDDSWKAGVSTKAFARISDRIAFYGKLSYSYFSGQNMGGQMLLDPLYNPVNFLEADVTTVGTKHREIYDLSGALSYSFSEKWAAGIKLDYTAGNYVKTKDPRYQTNLMDLDLSAGFTFAASDFLSLGLSAQYRKTMEQIYAHLFGTTDRQYNYYTDFGGFYGYSASVDGDEGYMPTQTARPMNNAFWGASLQVVLGKKAKFFNEFSYLVRDGYYGSKNSTSAVYFEFGGNIIEYQGKFVLPVGNAIHTFAADARMEKLKNSENSFRYTYETGKNVVVTYNGQNQVLDRSDMALNASYHGYLGVDGIRPSLEYGAEFSFFSRSQTTTVYPFYRISKYSQIHAQAFAVKNFICAKNVFGLGLTAGYKTGSGNPATDGAYVQGAKSSLKSFDNYLNAQFEYDTAACANAALSFKYTRLFSDRIAGFVKLSDSLQYLLSEPQYLSQRQHNVATLTLGCNF